ncbi:hypothetical protein [Persicobacter sp. CCB-QB2]|uniref:hypothetical protein n=1 Tax=Persicobacter sp. CCB-QB2 TaxID=1561025 RepID=UPI0006A97AF9|nr:hypothetical protein [Persicobacter sp. CCB-QB2]
MKLFNKYILGFLVVSFSFFSCEENIHETLYEGDYRVQWDYSQPLVAQEDGESARVTAILDKALSTDLEIFFEVAEENVVEGEDYTLSAKKIVIPAGELNGFVEVKAVFDPELVFEDRILTFTITGTNNDMIQLGFLDGTQKVAVSAEIQDKKEISFYEGLANDGNEWVVKSELYYYGEGIYTLDNAWGDYVAFYLGSDYAGQYKATVDFVLEEDNSVTITGQSAYCQIESLVFDEAEGTFDIVIWDSGVFSGGPYKMEVALEKVVN